MVPDKGAFKYMCAGGASFPVAWEILGWVTLTVPSRREQVCEWVAGPQLLIPEQTIG